MATLFYNISQILGISIVHSLWQGLLIYLALRLVFIIMPSLPSAAKHNLLFAGLTVLTVWFGCTFFIEAKEYNWAVNTFTYTPAVEKATPDNIDIALAAGNPAGRTLFKDEGRTVYQVLKTYLPYLSILYVAGLCFNLGRLSFAWRRVRAVKRSLLQAVSLQKKVGLFAQRLGITRLVKVNFSRAVNVPCTIGYLKPILLLPVTLTTQLSADEIETILLHELSHIKHNDYLLNLLQQVMAVLLFLNPFAQLLSRMTDRERENRCDDVVVQITGTPLTYAQALVILEEARLTELALAPAATGKKYQLLARIQRIMKADKPAVNIKHLVLATLIFICALGSISWLNPEIKNGTVVSEHGRRAIQQLATLVHQVIHRQQAANTTGEFSRTAKNDTTPRISPPDTTGQLANDTARLSDNARKVLADQWRSVSAALDQDRETLHALPLSKQLDQAQKLLDSMRNAAVVITPDIKQLQADRRKAWDEFMHSPEQLKKEATYRRMTRVYMDALQADPESIAFKREYERQKDSIQANLTKIGVIDMDGNVVWTQWQRAASTAENALHLRLTGKPNIKPIYDSLENARKAVYSGPEFDKVNNSTRASQAEIAAYQPAGLEKYKAVVAQLRARLQDTPEEKKYQADVKKHDQLVRILQR